MTQTLHMPLDLAGEYPAAAGRILELESEDQSFVDLAEAYDAVMSELQEIETGIEPACPAYCAQLQRKCAALRAQLFARLNA